MSLRKRVIGVAVGCAALLGSTSELQAQTPAPPVFGGELSKDCAWPTVVLVHMFYPEKPEGQQYGLCTGTLVHPKVVIFASHCGDAIGVSVGQDRHAPKRIREFAKVGRNPEWKNHPKYTKVDWAYAVLKEPLEGAATIPIAYGCELDMVQKQGQDVRLVGYSDNGASGAAPDPDAFIQRWAKAKIAKIGGGVMIAGAQGVGVRSGDSGGPILTQLKDGTWRTVGIISRADGSAAAVTKEMVQWLNKETGIDVVPCFDDDGKPTEGKACDELRAFSGDPTAPVAKEENNCIGAPSKWAGLACGLSKSDGSDPDADKGDDEPKDKDKPKDDEDGKSEDDKDKDGKSEDDEDGKSEEDEDGDSEDEDEDGGSEKEDGKKGKSKKKSKKKTSKSKKKSAKGASDGESKPSGCDVALSGGSSPVWMFLGLLGFVGIRRRSRR